MSNRDCGQVAKQSGQVAAFSPRRHNAEMKTASSTNPTSIADGVDIPRLRRRLLNWYDRHRRDLPWRSDDPDPYAVWLSEMMLQQTQTSTVAPYYAAFLKAYPNVEALAAADRDDILAMWAGLGYYRRAHHLHDAAKIVADELGGCFPDTVRALMELPGVGRYSAGAIASIAFGVSAPILDGNVKRVLSRVFAIRDSQSDAKTIELLWDISAKVIPRKRCGDFNQALMDLGATTCTPKVPGCGTCPLKQLCIAKQRDLVDEIPPVRKRTKPTHLDLTALVIEANGHVLLHRRADSGLWAGMWELPNVEANGKSITAVCETILPASIQESLSEFVKSCSVQHQLTHRSVWFNVYRANCRKSRLPKAFQWAKRNDVLPLPKAFKKILSTM
ncbi:MAG: A/G-specific adenine glycosylase [Phycisphaerae bacterium]|nr:MAG: A/G-specific adenine glycosylase [Phycisphaerae bacterium]